MPPIQLGDVSTLRDPAEMKVLQGRHRAPGFIKRLTLSSARLKPCITRAHKGPLACQGAKGVGAGSGDASAEDWAPADWAGIGFLLLISPTSPEPPF